VVTEDQHGTTRIKQSHPRTMAPNTVSLGPAYKKAGFIERTEPVLP
jgi:hypothetical protein